jgi:hypothetical protein
MANRIARLTTPAAFRKHAPMKSRLLFCLITSLVLAVRHGHTEEANNWEKISSPSPDKKFAMRIVCENEPAEPENIDSSEVKALEIVAMPGKEVVGTLTPGDYKGFHLIWASDSKWFAYYSLSGPRVGDTYVYRLEAGKFVLLNTDELSVPVKGDARNQYIEPVRWSKPGTLVLKQYTIFRGDAGDSTIQFTVRFDDSGKFHVISKKKSG